MSLNMRPNNPMLAFRKGELQQRSAAVRGIQASFEPYSGGAWCRPRLSYPLAGRTQSGFTLVELMVVIAVLAILATIAIPSFQGIVAENRATSAANEFLATLQLARSAALAQSRPVTVRPIDDDEGWDLGWVVETVEEPVVVLRESPALRPSVSLHGAADVEFSSTGTLAGQTPTPFVLKVESGPGASRAICMTLGGSSKVIRGDTCD